MDTLRITTFQSDLVWEDIPANLAAWDEKMASLREKTDLIVLPEMFNTGFSMHTEALAEEMGGRTMQWMIQTARDRQAVIIGSLMISDGGKCYNRLLAVFPDGKYYHYDKRHLFSLAGEQEHFASGNERLLFPIKNWWICPLICYDLRFPVWGRNMGPYYDVLIYIANFPASRIQAWNALLPARAIENQAYTVGVNRVGTDGKGIAYDGHSQILDFAGECLYKASTTEDMATIALDKKALIQYRKRFPFLQDQDFFEIVR